MLVRKVEGRLSVELRVERVGADLLAVLTGGAAHLGTAVLAVPRPSLAEPGRTSCTSSVLNHTGHKDGYLCRKVAETLCSRYAAVTVCTGGIHYDGATGEELKTLAELTEQALACLEAEAIWL